MCIYIYNTNNNNNNTYIYISYHCRLPCIMYDMYHLYYIAALGAGTETASALASVGWHYLSNADCLIIRPRHYLYDPANLFCCIFHNL